MNKLLELRNKLKKRKPKFQRQDGHAKDSFEGVWRRPRGLHSKMRRNKDGHRRMPSIGYGSPSSVKNLDAKGMNRVLIKTLKDLKGLDVKKDVVVISASIGKRVKVRLLEEIKKLGLTVKNVKDVDAFISNAKEAKVEAKKERQSKKELREKAKAESLKQKKGDEKATKEVKTEEKSPVKVEDKEVKTEKKVVKKKVVKKVEEKKDESSK